MFTLCDYKDIFGKPRTGLHAYRFLDIAIVDVVATIFISYLLHNYTGSGFNKIFSGLCLASVVIHKMFCVDTKINQLIFD